MGNTTLQFSSASLIAGTKRPGSRTACSTSAGWKSLLVQTYEQPGTVEHYETTTSPDTLVVVLLRGEYQIESYSSGSWKRTTYRAGDGGVTAPHTSNRLRWYGRSASASTLLRLYIPQAYFVEAQEEYRRSGLSSLPSVPDSLLLSDPTVFSVANSLMQKAAEGAPDLYADAGARFLATHLLAPPAATGAALLQPCKQELTDRRLARVVDYLRHHFAETLTVDELAREAGISRFHLSRLFKMKTGLTPHKFLVTIRVGHAAELLRTTDLSVAEIALSCGYQHCGHFATAFHSFFGITPAAFRKTPADGRISAQIALSTAVLG